LLKGNRKCLGYRFFGGIEVPRNSPEDSYGTPVLATKNSFNLDVRF
jgi:hypothetical protein